MPLESAVVGCGEEVESSSTSYEASAQGSQELVMKTYKSQEFKANDEPDNPRDLCNPPLMRPETLEGVNVCRICQCADPEKPGEVALKSLGICSPAYSMQEDVIGRVQFLDRDEEKEESHVVEDVSQATFSSGSSKDNLEGVQPINGSLIELGCACRGDLSLVHYACALRWFAGRDSLVCEICGATASTIRVADCDKVISTLREKYMLLRSVQGDAGPQSCSTNVLAFLPSVCGWPALDAVSWFDPHGNLVHGLSRDPVIDIPDVQRRPPNSVSMATKWAVEGTGLLVATGLLTVTITWLLAPHVSKAVARRGFSVLLAGLCALAIVIFLRFGVLPRIKYGPARYWAILVVFWFLIFGVWASSTRTTRTSP